MDGQKAADASGNAAKSATGNSNDAALAAELATEDSKEPLSNQQSPLPAGKSSGAAASTADFEFNILLLGDSGVGKSTLIWREIHQNNDTMASSK